jgi:prepilin-type processing-associated H-X9-DG protein
LLVVVAIIAVLIAVLLPAIQSARAKANQVTCLTHLRQIGVAMFIYAQTESIFPPDYIPNGMEGTTYDNSYWPQKLMLSSLKDSPEVLVCPNYFKSPEASFLPTYNYYYWFCRTSLASRYGFNHLTLGCGGYAKTGFGCVADDGSKKVKTGPDQVTYPSKLVMCYDNRVTFGNPPCRYGSSNEYLNAYYFPVEIRHSGGLNLSFVDGHAEWADYDSDYFSDNTQNWVNER